VQVPDPFFHGPVATNRFTMSLLSAGFTFALRQFIFVVFSNQDCQQHLDIKKPVILMYAILHACLLNDLNLQPEFLEGAEEDVLV